MRNFVIALAIVIVGGVVYFLYASNQSPAQTSQTPTDQTQASITQTPAPTPSPGPVVAPAAPKPISIAISNFSFSPSQISVKVGTKVTWTNKDSAAHTVTSNSGVFSSGTLSTGGMYSFVFNTPGTFSYHCNFHPSMKATIVVTQ